MSLADLAATMEGLGYHNGDVVQHDDSVCFSRCVSDDDGERTIILNAYRPKANWPNGGLYLVEHDEANENSYRITATLTQTDIHALSLIAAWQGQSDAEPRRADAGMVTITDKALGTIRASALENWDVQTGMVSDKQWAQFRSDVEAALNGGRDEQG